jgi:hypothetical protein
MQNDESAPLSPGLDVQGDGIQLFPAEAVDLDPPLQTPLRSQIHGKVNENEEQPPLAETAVRVSTNFCRPAEASFSNKGQEKNVRKTYD